MRGAILGGRYQLRERLGAGGMGTVWRASDRLRDRSVAVKTLTDFDESQTSELARRFRREIRVTSLLRDPHVVEAHDSGETVVDGSPLLYLVMEEVPGEPLHRVLGDRTASLAEVARWGEGICTALSVMHRAGIVHRDLKPANVMVGPDGHATVLDFGIARLEGRGVDLSTLTQTGHLVGTVAYMSPEQAKNPTTLDGRSDLYSLGCLLYTALAGRPPFEGPSPYYVLHQHLDKDPVPPSAHRAGLPAAWDALVLTLLAKEPDDRPRDAAEARARIAELPRPAEAPRAAEAPPAAAAARTVTAVDPEAVTADAAAAPGTAPAPTRRLPASALPPPPIVPGDEVIARGLHGRRLLAFVAAVLAALSGLSTVVLVVSGGEVGSSLITSGFITVGGLLVVVVLAIAANAGEQSARSEDKRRAAAGNRRATTENAPSRAADGTNGRNGRNPGDKAPEPARPVPHDSLAALTLAIQSGRPLWVAYESAHGDIRWAHLFFLRFDSGSLAGREVGSGNAYRIAEFRLRGTSVTRPPGV